MIDTSDFKPRTGENLVISTYVVSMAKSKSESSEVRPEAPKRGKGDRPTDLAGPPQKPGEVGGRKGPEPTRYGDWEVGGRCTDF